MNGQDATGEPASRQDGAPPGEQRGAASGQPAPETGGAGETGAPADAGPRSQEVTISITEYEELKTLAAERDEYLKRLQRAVADYHNLQNRTERAREGLRREAIKQVARRIMALADSLTRARQACMQTNGTDNITEGLRLVEREFYTVLESMGIRPMEPMGKPFDPRYHDAVLEEHVEGAEPGTVVRELNVGFVMGDEVIRPAQVVVAAPPRP